MKLYYSSGACSLSPHIVLCESGLPFDLVKVDLRTHKTEDGRDFLAIDPKGYVPTLELDNGEILTEGAVIVQYIADQVPALELAPAAGTLARYRLMEWLNFIATELHKGFGPLFNASMPAEAKQFAHDKLMLRLKWVDSQLAKGPYLLGDKFSVADAYLFTILRWARAVRLEMDGFGNLNAFVERMRSRAGVQAALQAEGLAGK